MIVWLLEVEDNKYLHLYPMVNMAKSPFPINTWNKEQGTYYEWLY